MQSTAVCSNCGTERTLTDLRCANCGKLLSPMMSIPQRVNAPTSVSQNNVQSTFAKGLLSFNGRIGRLEYFLTNVGIWIGASCLGFLASLLASFNESVFIIIVLLLLLIVVLAGALLGFFATLKRGHDIERSALENIIFSIIPFVNIWWAFMLLFKKGSFGPNLYGPPPSKN